MDIHELFAAFSNLKVLVIGDVMLDSYVWGKVERISPEAPVPVLNVVKREYRLGGAGNVLLNVQSLGAQAIICTVIGDDREGDVLESELKARGLSCAGVLRSETRITTIKERIIASSQQIVRVDTETDQLITQKESDGLLRRIEELLPGCDVVIFEDYDKGVLSENLIRDVIGMTLRLGIPTVVDPKKRNFLAYKKTSLFKPNLKELREGLKADFNPDNPDSLKETVQLLIDTLQAEGALITMSERGVYINYKEEKHHLPAHIRHIADVSGAGDTVISIAACCLAMKLPPQQIAALSNLGGGLVCEKVGVVPIEKERLIAEALRLSIL